MSKRRWKNLQPTSLRHASELCKEFARVERNLSVEGIATEAGMVDHWTLYKYFQNGRMPLALLRPFERACGIDYITRWIAASAGKLLIDIPRGRSANPQDMQALQEILTETTGALLAFYAGKNDTPDTLAALQSALEQLAWHRANVQQHATPQLNLGEQP
ncbi:hypothetical protein D3C77_248280 [compost metagenome]